MRGLKRFLSSIDTFSEWVGRVIGYLVIVMMLALIYEVVLRYVFNNPTKWAHELTQMVFGGYFMLLGGYALYWRAHISMDLLYSRWSPRVRAIMDVITSLLFFFFCGTLLYLGGKYAWDATLVLEHSRTPWHPPVYPFKMCIPVGGFLILLPGLTKLIRDLNRAIRGKEL